MGWFLNCVWKIYLSTFMYMYMYIIMYVQCVLLLWPMAHCLCQCIHVMYAVTCMVQAYIHVYGLHALAWAHYKRVCVCVWTLILYTCVCTVSKQRLQCIYTNHYGAEGTDHNIWSWLSSSGQTMLLNYKQYRYMLCTRTRTCTCMYTCTCTRVVCYSLNL